MSSSDAAATVAVDISRPHASQRTAMAPRRIWIDLDNTPHVPFFLPIIRALERDGHCVIVTARDAFQVCSLADYHGLKYQRVGRHYGANKTMKIAGTVWRAAQLLPIVRRQQPHVAISHGSRPLELLSSMLRIPSMLVFDYEHARRLPFLKPTLGMAPDAIKAPQLSKAFKYGLRTYHGLKEDVYAVSFRPDPSILTELGVAPADILVTLRPPATEAHYHNPEAERLFVEVVNVLGRVANLRMVILPRTAGAQHDFVRRTWPAWYDEQKIIIPTRAVDGLNLVWHSDLVVSGGGTMNREAAALGVPVYSIFRGKLGAVDRCLAEDGRLMLLETIEDVQSKLMPMKRDRKAGPGLAVRPAIDEILAATAELLELSHGR